jgi:post-segregation antitoxin (ccd killing protein)
LIDLIRIRSKTGKVGKPVETASLRIHFAPARAAPPPALVGRDAEQSVEFASEALIEILRHTHGYPYFLQERGYERFGTSLRPRTPLCVYVMRMARVNVYLPDDLAMSAREAGINVSAVTQQALRTALARSHTDRWLERLNDRPGVELDHQLVLDALEQARDEFGA